MTTNEIYTPAHGTDPQQSVRIEKFASYSPSGCCELVVSSFRNAGKLRDYVRQHSLAEENYDCNFNGYGYADHVNRYLLSPEDAIVVQRMLTEKGKQRPKQSFDQQKAAWARRLVKFTDIPFDEALALANEKIDAQDKQVQELTARQYDRYSPRREKLINSIIRQNPLRRIEDEEHAFRILQASVRHKASNYEDCLQEAQRLARWGELDHAEVRDYARQHAQYNGDVASHFSIKTNTRNEQ